MATKRKAIDALESSEMTIVPLGSGNEVGRSCHILKFKGKTIMLDCGIHPGYSGPGALPYFDEIDPAEVDLMLVSHFHLDHIAALPYFTEKTSFKGRVFMTHPTKAVMRIMLSDYIRVSNIGSEEMLYDEKDLQRCADKVELLDYHQEVEVDGVRFWCYSAGHVLGAAMFAIEIAGVRVLYTGDYSRQEDRHLRAAELPSFSPDVLMVESTYGVQQHEPREEREQRFTSAVERIVTRGGRCLIPVFALGRAQEVLLILEEFWRSRPDLHAIPIYYASRLAAKSLRVYQTYVNMMNDRVRALAETKNVFHFEYISNLKNTESFDDVGPAVVMASPGMLQNGMSRELFERWCVDKRNGVLLPGYSVEGTLAKKIQTKPSTIRTLAGRHVPLNAEVHAISFSAHSDFQDTSGFVAALKPPNVVLVHGEQNEMRRLKEALSSRHRAKVQSGEFQVLMPANCQSVSLIFKERRTAKLMGTLAQQALRPGAPVHGLVVSHNFTHRVVAPSELTTLTQLTTGSVKLRQLVPFHQKFPLLVRFLSCVFDSLEMFEQNGLPGARLGTSGVTVAQHSSTRLVVEWAGGAVADMVADAVVALILQAETSPASIRATSVPCGHAHAHAHAHSHTHSPPVKAEPDASKAAAPALPPVSEDAMAESDETADEAAGAASSDAGSRSQSQALEVVAAWMHEQFGQEIVEVGPDAVTLDLPLGSLRVWVEGSHVHVDAPFAPTEGVRLESRLQAVVDTLQPVPLSSMAEHE